MKKVILGIFIFTMLVITSCGNKKSAAASEATVDSTKVEVVDTVKVQ